MFEEPIVRMPTVRIEVPVQENEKSLGHVRARSLSEDAVTAKDLFWRMQLDVQAHLDFSVEVVPATCLKAEEQARLANPYDLHDKDNEEKLIGVKVSMWPRTREHSKEDAVQLPPAEPAKREKRSRTDGDPSRSAKKRATGPGVRGQRSSPYLPAQGRPEVAAPTRIALEPPDRLVPGLKNVLRKVHREEVLEAKDLECLMNFRLQGKTVQDSEARTKQFIFAWVRVWAHLKNCEQQDLAESVINAGVSLFAKNRVKTYPSTYTKAENRPHFHAIDQASQYVAAGNTPVDFARALRGATNIAGANFLRRVSLLEDNPQAVPALDAAALKLSLDPYFLEET